MSLSGSCTFKELKESDDMENGEVAYSTENVESTPTQSLTFGKQRRRTIEKILIAIVVILFIVCLILGVLYALELKKSKKTEKKSSDNFCYSSSCLEVASRVMKDMNKSADPCDNFMKFSCDGWVKANPIPEGENEGASMFVLTNMNNQKLRFIIERLGDYDNSHPYEKVKNYFASCMNEDSIERNSLQDFQDVLKSLGPWPVLMNKTWNSTNWNWTDKMATLMDKNPLFSIEVMVNPKNTEENTFQIYPPDIGIKEAYDKNDTKVLNALLDYMVRVIVLLGGDENKARAQMKDAVDFEMAFAKSVPSFGDIYSNWYNTYTIEYLEKHTGFPWLRYLNKMLDEINGTRLDVTKTLVVPHLGYFKNLVKIIEKTEKRTLLNYFMWSAVKSNLEYMTSAFKEAFNEFKLKSEGTVGTKARWLECIIQMNARQGLTMALGKLFIDNEFDKDIVPLLKEMLFNIKKAFKDEVAELEWLDEESKKNVFAKVDLMKDKMGFPDLCNNMTLLKKHYQDLEINTKDHYLLNALNVSRWFSRTFFAKVGQPVDHEEWYAGPQIVNAFYKMSQNEINIYAGILQPPFYYGRHALRAVNFGAIGTVLGHELTHGFDSLGSRFNKFGEIGKPWMSNYSLNEFQKRSRCLVDQYNNYYSDLGNGESVKNDGAQTLSENIADNGGLRLAYRGYKNWLAEHGEEKEVPGLGLTNEQLLFLAFGQLYCYKANPTGIKRRIQTDSHAMPEFRAIGSVSNMKTFSQLFKCPKDSKMNPPTKCRVW